MKNIFTATLFVFSFLLLISCGSTGSGQEATAAGFSEIENQIKQRFGEKAFYTDLSISYNKSIGNIIGVTVTENPASLQLEQWSQAQDKWTQKADITIEVPAGMKAADYMFQLNQNLNLKKLGELVEQSKAKLTKEKSIKNPKLHIASIQFPDNGDISKAEYLVILQPENGGTSFSFRYTLAGELVKMGY